MKRASRVLEREPGGRDVVGQGVLAPSPPRRGLSNKSLVSSGVSPPLCVQIARTLGGCWGRPDREPAVWDTER